jgi:hypothetical protein
LDLDVFINLISMAHNRPVSIQSQAGNFKFCLIAAREQSMGRLLRARKGVTDHGKQDIGKTN